MIPELCRYNIRRWGYLSAYPKNCLSLNIPSASRQHIIEEYTDTNVHTFWGLLYVSTVYGKRSARKGASEYARYHKSKIIEHTL